MVLHHRNREHGPVLPIRVGMVRKARAVLARGGTYATLARFALVAAMVVAVGTCETIQDKAFANDDALDLARVLVAEGGRQRTPDHVAILWTLSRRQRLRAFLGWPLPRLARAYSVSYNGRAVNVERAARMRALPREQIPRHVLALVEGWLAGRRPADPCRGRAMHWAAPSVRSPLRRVDCGDTRNAFYLGPDR